MNHSFLRPAAGSVLLAMAITAGASDTRQLDSHEHGHAVLNVAVDNKDLLIEFESPAANIVGFEHEPENAEQEAAIEKAEETLSDAGAVFALPAAAGCKLAEVEVEAPHEEHGDHGKEKHDEHKHEDKHDDHKDEHKHDGEVHSEFHATWVFACADIDKLDSIDVKIFELFPGTEEIDANIIGRTGQGAAELSASNTRISL